MFLVPSYGAICGGVNTLKTVGCGALGRVVRWGGWSRSSVGGSGCKQDRKEGQEGDVDWGRHRCALRRVSYRGIQSRIEQVSVHSRRWQRFCRVHLHRVRVRVDHDLKGVSATAVPNQPASRMRAQCLRRCAIGALCCGNRRLLHLSEVQRMSLWSYIYAGERIAANGVTRQIVTNQHSVVQPFIDDRHL